MSLINNKEIIAENKLIILYIISKFEKPVGNLELTGFILENNLINYFVTQELLNDLARDKYVHGQKKDGRSEYFIGDKGSRTLKILDNFILPSLKKYIDDAFIKSKKETLKRTSVIAESIPESENRFTSRLMIKENDFVLIDLKVASGSREDSRNLCENWKVNAPAIYPEILEILFKERS